jgi:uncharacterized protein (TIGR03086 family)
MKQYTVAGIQQLSKTFACTRAVLAAVRPDQLDLPTPCESWDVRALINHFVGSARWAAAAILSRDAADGEDYAAGNFLAAYDEIIIAALAAFDTEGVEEKTIVLPFGEFSGAGLMSLAAREQFTHGWDLARAIGYPSDLAPELAEELLAGARTEITEGYRGPDGIGFFGPIVEAAADTCPADQLAAFLGRKLKVQTSIHRRQ